MNDFDSIASDLEGGSQPAQSKAPAFNPSQSYGTPAKLLDNLQATESSGNRYAINKDTKAMGPYQFTPDTVAMLHKQGVKFDPFDPQQARAAADYYVSRLAQQNNGDYTKAMAQYGGFKTKDPSAYVGKVLNGVQASAQQPSEFDSIAADLSAPTNKASAQPPADMTVTVTPNRGGFPQPKPGAKWGPSSLSESFRNVVDTAKGVGETALNQVSGVGANIIGGWRGLSELAQGHGIDAAANAVRSEVEQGTYQPQTEGGKNLTEAASIPAQAIDYVAGKAGNAVNQAAGPGAATVVHTAIDALPMLFLRKGGGKPVTMPSLKVQPSSMEALVKTVPVDSVIAQAPAAQTVPMTGKQAPETVAAQGTSQPGVSTVSQQPKITPTAQIKEAAALPPIEQVARANVLKAVGIDDARLSAIEGHPLNAASEFQMGKFNEPAGQAAKAQFAAEKAALQAHTEGMVEKSGGSLGMDQETRLARGNSILAPLDSLKQWFDDKTNQLYTAARERAQGQPVTLQSTNDVLGQKSNFSGNSDSLQLRNGVQDRMQELGMLDDKGNLISSTVDQAENLRKYLNEQWSPKNSHVLGKLKDALDDDVMSMAGEDIFKEARDMRA
ncbi:MAG TPA: lytic transglycosylase domain-containing protein, partial [Candidatus Paceibacterota bacterium]